MDVSSMMFADPALIDTIVGELKSQGTFDQFRKECIADVDTKPAYQNLHQRVEATVSNFLEGRMWRPDLNKNQLRDSLRKHILEMGFLDTGVERIVDQVVNPKVNTVFMPQVEEVVYRVQGIPKPDKKILSNPASATGSTSKSRGVFSSNIFNQPPPFLPGLSFLPPALQSHMQKAPTLADLLPTDLDPVSSPESSKDSETREDCESSKAPEESGIVQHHEDSVESQLSGISDLTSHGSDRAASVKSGRRETAPCDDANGNSLHSNVSSKSRVSCKQGSQVFDDCAVQSGKEDQHIDRPTGKTNFEDGCEKSYPLLHYGDQFSVEEEVATTVGHTQCDISNEVSMKVETAEDFDQKERDSKNEVSEVKSLPEVPLIKPKVECLEVQKYELAFDTCSNNMDDNSTAQSEDSQLSGSSDNKLHIDELKDFNSQSENSHQNDDEQSGMKTSSEGFMSEDSSKPKSVVENVVEASEEARHGFDDSQDALERPPLPAPTSAHQNLIRPPLPPLTVIDSSSDVEGKSLPAPSPLVVCQDNFDHSPLKPPLTPPLPVICNSSDHSSNLAKSSSEGQNANEKPYIPATPSVERVVLEERPPLPPTPVAPEYPPLPPATPPLPDCPPLPPTPPLPESLDMRKRPSLPPTPPLPEKQSFTDPQLLPSEIFPPRLGSLDSHSQHVQEATEPVVLPSGLSQEEFNHDSNLSPSYDDGAIPKTPQWEPRSPIIEDNKHTLSAFECLGISNPSKMTKSFLPSSRRVLNEQDDVSQSGSEEMQLAWSPLSTHGDDISEECKENVTASRRELSEEATSAQVVRSSLPIDRMMEVRGHTIHRERDLKRDIKHKSDKGDKHRERDRGKDSRGKEKLKDDGRIHKESASSSKKHDDSSTRHRENRDRKDSSSRSRHDDKSRCDKNRDRHSSSSHHRSDDKLKDEKRDDKEKNSSKHKSSHSDDRHRHRDKSHKSGSSASSSGRHEDKTHDRSSKSEEKSKSSSKSQSSEKDRRDLDHRDKDIEEKSRKSHKDKDRQRKESTRHDEKRKEKEREKTKKDKNTSMCRPTNDRRSPDCDNNNGSMFGSSNQTSFEGLSNTSQTPDTVNQNGDKGSGSTDSSSKSSESSQNNNSAELLLSPTTNQFCPSSSLPFKKRPLMPESDLYDARQESIYGKLILRVKRFKGCTSTTEGPRGRKRRALRRLECESIRNLDNCLKYTSKAYTDTFLPPLVGSPTKYFETDWPTKLDDRAFLAYVDNLERSKTLSGLSDFSQSDSEEEEVLSMDNFNTESVIEGKNVVFSLSVLTGDETKILVEPKIESSSFKRTTIKSLQSKPCRTSIKAKNRSRSKKLLNDNVSVKHRKVLNKNTVEFAPAEQKTRRARKPNKRYANDEFTSHFGNDDIEQSEDNHMEERTCCAEEKSTVVLENHLPKAMEKATEAANSKHCNIDNLENKKAISSFIERSSAASSNSAAKPFPNQSKDGAYSWNKESYNSNSEDEADNINESDLIGTALKNLMMESGLGGPDEASRSQKSSSNTLPNFTNSLSGRNQKAIPLSGVKRVGLSKNYKRGKKFSAKPAVASSEFSFYPRSGCDVSASSFEKGSPVVKQDSDMSTESSSRKYEVSHIKQHYTSDDLYKPRPPLRLLSKRRYASNFSVQF